MQLFALAWAALLISLSAELERVVISSCVVQDSPFLFFINVQDSPLFIKLLCDAKALLSEISW